MEQPHRRKAFLSTFPPDCVLRLSSTLSGSVGKLGTWADQSGAGADFVLYGDAVVTAGTGLVLDGTGDYAKRTASNPLARSAFTVCAWLQQASPGTDSYWFDTSARTLMTYHGIPAKGWTPYCKGTAVISKTDIAHTSWAWVCLTVDTVNDVEYLYGNNSQVASGTTACAAESGGSCWLGCKYTGAELWKGEMDEIMVFSRVLTSAERATVMAINAKA